MSAVTLLDRLDGVRRSGPDRWLAQCPAHDDRTPSLSVRELDDGTVLINCFAGCGAADVVAAVSLELRDLFPGRAAEHRRKPFHARIPAGDALIAIDHEAHVVAVTAIDILEHREIDEPTWGRLKQAAHRIGEARIHVSPAKIKVTP